MASIKKRLTLLLLIFPYFVIVNIVFARFIWALITGNTERAWIIAIGTDQLLNAAANGSEDETISSRAARARDKGEKWACVLCKILDFFERDHCTKSRGV